VAARRGRIQELTDERVDAALARGRLDVVRDLGRPIALTIAAELLGLPAEMHVPCGDRARDLIYRVDVFTVTPARWERGLMAMIGLAPLLRELLLHGRAHPPAEEGLLWALERARIRGEMTEDQVVGHGALLLMAGHITTQHLVGNGVLALLRNPEQWTKLCERPELIKSAVEELLRYDPPSAATTRVAREDITIAGETLRRGEPLALLFGAANRDPAIFHEPDVLDITRSPNPHLAFGYDAHHCIGAALARLEAEIMIGTLARRAPQLRLESGNLQWEDTLMVRGLRSLPTLL
jgi:cytochrome P450